MVSRLLRDKGLYEYVEAARQVKTRYPAARFQVLGARDARNPGVVPQADLKRWESGGMVDLLGEVSDVRRAVADADVVVLPSYREGIPRALLEAAAMAKPIITTDAVGCREAVDHEQTGLLVPIRDVPALAEAMIRMNRHFQAQMPELKPTAGYVQDARRYLVEIEPIIRSCEIDRKALVRNC